MNKINNYLENIYETFITRDICYILGGVIQIVFLKYIYDGRIIELINYFTKDIFKFFILLLFSYSFGVIIQEGLSFVGVVTTKCNFPKGFNNHIEVMDYLRSKYHIVSVREVERVVFLKHFGACVGGSLFLGIILWAISIFILKRDLNKNNIICMIFLLFPTVVCIIENRWKARQQGEIVKSLIERKNNKN